MYIHLNECMHACMPISTARLGDVPLEASRSLGDDLRQDRWSVFKSPAFPATRVCFCDLLAHFLGVLIIRARPNIFGIFGSI